MVFPHARSAEEAEPGAHWLESAPLRSFAFVLSFDSGIPSRTLKNFEFSSESKNL